MAIPLIVSEPIFRAAAATATTTLNSVNSEFGKCLSLIVRIETTGFSGAIDIQGRSHPEATYSNLLYATLDSTTPTVSAAQLSYTLSTATVVYLVPVSRLETRIVMTRTAGTVSVFVEGVGEAVPFPFDTIGAVTFTYLDDIAARWGTDGDIRAHLASAIVAADAEPNASYVGVSDHQGTAANSFILSNITASGDFQVLVNSGGASIEAVLIDTSALKTFLGHGGIDTHQANGSGLVVGHTAQITLNALIPELQVVGTVVGVDAAMAAVLYSATAGEGAEVVLGRSKSATLGTNTIVASGDQLGRILGVGADGSTGFDPAGSIRFEVDGTPGATNDMPGRIVLSTTPDGSGTLTESFRVASDQNVYIGNGNGAVVGHTAQVTLGDLSEFQVLGTANGDAMVVIGRFSADANPTRLAFLKSRHATIGSNTIIQDGDIVARIVAYGADGTDFASISSQIDMAIDGTPGVGDMPGRIVIATSRDGAESPTEVVRFTAQQSALFSNAGPNISEPTANPADRAGIYCVDLSAGNATLGILTETAVAVEAALASTHTLAVRVNGVTYRILLTNA